MTVGFSLKVDKSHQRRGRGAALGEGRQRFGEIAGSQFLLGTPRLLGYHSGFLALVFLSSRTQHPEVQKQFAP